MNVVCVFLDKDGNAQLRALEDVDSVEAIHLRVLRHLANQLPIRWTFVLAFELEKPVGRIADLASYNAWQPTEPQLQQVHRWLVKDELARLIQRHGRDSVAGVA